MRDDLRRHLERTGNTESMLRDAPLNVAMEYTSSLMDLVEAALNDELEPFREGREITHRVLDKIMYGATPLPADIQYRQGLLRSPGAAMLTAARIFCSSAAVSFVSRPST